MASKLKKTSPASGSGRLKTCNDCGFYKTLTINHQLSNPVFSLKYIQPEWGIEDCEKDDKVAFATKLSELSKLTWQDIIQSHRHGAGSEIIDRASLSVPIPNSIKDDTKFISIRFSGMKPMIGFRDRDILHIVWIDHCYKVYKH